MSFPNRYKILIAILVLGVVARFLSGALLFPMVADQELGSETPNWRVLELLVRWSPLLFGQSSQWYLEDLLSESEPSFAIAAHTALSRVNPGRAAGFLDNAESKLDRRGIWWAPPVPSRELLSALETFESLGRNWSSSAISLQIPAKHRRAAQHSCILVGVAGNRSVIFPHRYLGTKHDLWLYSEVAEKSVFLGYLLASPYDRDLTLVCSMDTGVLVLDWIDDSPPSKCGRPEPELESILLGIPETGQDSDGDSIPDLAESRLRLDPYRADTDADGVPDAEDYSPNGGWQPNEGSAEAAAVTALYLTQLLLPDSCPWSTVSFVAANSPIEWQGICGPIVNIPSDEVDLQPEGSDLLYIYPGVSGEADDYFETEGLLPTSIDEVVDRFFKPAGTTLLLINDHIGSDSEGYDVRVRSTRYRPLVVWHENLWF